MAQLRLYAFRFAPEQYDQVTAFVGNERRCWPFLHFDLIVKPDGGPLTLHMSGRERVKTILLSCGCTMTLHSRGRVVANTKV
jgi:hypothetical protein